ncbi:MAG: hypothetical protein M5R36_14780 [Deltaproteobacteria bacterium]|nr:hypothetical protein [Deltaproteobacteria bacterium]
MASLGAAAAISAAAFMAVVYFSYQKYLCLDVTHFDLQILTWLYGLFWSDGLGAVTGENAYNLFFMIQEPSHIPALLAYGAAPSAVTLFVLHGLYFSVSLFFCYVIVFDRTKNAAAALACQAALALNPYLWTFFTLGFRSYLLRRRGIWRFSISTARNANASRWRAFSSRDFPSSISCSCMRFSGF